MVASTHSSTWQFPGAVQLSHLLESFDAFRARRAKVARLITELNSYTDRELQDFGLSRLDIPSVANGTYRDGR